MASANRQVSRDATPRAAVAPHLPTRGSRGSPNLYQVRRDLAGARAEGEDVWRMAATRLKTTNIGSGGRSRCPRHGRRCCSNVKPSRRSKSAMSSRCGHAPGTVYGMVSRLDVANPGLQAFRPGFENSRDRIRRRDRQSRRRADRLSTRNLGLSGAGRAGLARNPRRFDAGLCPARSRDRADRFDPPGRERASLHPDRRTVRQAFQHRRHHRRGQILPRRRDPRRGHRPCPERAPDAARPA